MLIKTTKHVNIRGTVIVYTQQQKVKKNIYQSPYMLSEHEQLVSLSFELITIFKLVMLFISNCKGSINAMNQ